MNDNKKAAPVLAHRNGLADETQSERHVIRPYSTMKGVLNQ